ncbi:hypothetical protein JCM15060_22590 [Halanaerobaculum tunisiense]
MKKTKANRKSGDSDGGKELITDGTASEGHIFWTLNQNKDENKTYLYSMNIHVKRNIWGAECLNWARSVLRGVYTNYIRNKSIIFK